MENLPRIVDVAIDATGLAQMLQQITNRLQALENLIVHQSDSLTRYSNQQNTLMNIVKNIKGSVLLTGENSPIVIDYITPTEEPILFQEDTFASKIMKIFTIGENKLLICSHDPTAIDPITFLVRIVKAVRADTSLRIGDTISSNLYSGLRVPTDQIEQYLDLDALSNDNDKLEIVAFINDEEKCIELVDLAQFDHIYEAPEKSRKDMVRAVKRSMSSPDPTSSHDRRTSIIPTPMDRALHSNHSTKPHLPPSFPIDRRNSHLQFVEVPMENHLVPLEKSHLESSSSSLLSQLSTSLLVGKLSVDTMHTIFDSFSQIIGKVTSPPPTSYRLSRRPSLRYITATHMQLIS